MGGLCCIKKPRSVCPSGASLSCPLAVPRSVVVGNPVKVIKCKVPIMMFSPALRVNDILRQSSSRSEGIPESARYEMGARGRRLVEEKYTWDAVVKAMVKGYEEVIPRYRQD